METTNNQELELQQEISEMLDTIENVEENVNEELSQISPDDIQNDFTLYMELLEAEYIKRDEESFLDYLDEENVEYELAA